MPSFSRQTGQNCNVCHTQSFGPNLTPFGRDFKLGRYTVGGGSGTAAKLPALSGMVQGSFTNTQKNQTVQSQDRPDGTLRPGYNKNNNFTFDQASLFYAGRIYGKVGAFSQLTYNGYDERLEMDNTDIRFADQLDFDTPITYGISLNNNPTVQDLWNTTPVWGFPYTGSGVQPSVGVTPLIDGALGSQVGGATAYTMINNLLYLEAGAYGSFSSNFQNAFGIAGPDRISLDGAAPYWRVALQHDWRGNYFSLGHYGMSADVFLDVTRLLAQLIIPMSQSMRLTSTWRIRSISLKPKLLIFMKIRIYQQLDQRHPIRLRVELIWQRITSISLIHSTRPMV